MDKNDINYWVERSVKKNEDFKEYIDKKEFDMYKMRSFMALNDLMREADNVRQGSYVIYAVMNNFFPELFSDILYLDEMKEEKLISPLNYYEISDKKIVDVIKKNGKIVTSSRLKRNELDVMVPIIGKREISNDIFYPRNENHVIGALKLNVPKKPKHESAENLIFFFEKFAGRAGYGLHNAFLIETLRDTNEYVKHTGRVISHDAKNSITNIYSIAKHLLKTEQNDETKEKYQEILKRCLNLERHLMSWMQTSPSEIKMMKARNEKVDLVNLIDNAIDSHFYDIESEKIQLTKNYLCDEAYIVGDIKWLFSAYNNLIENAIKYGNKKEIKIGIENIDDFYRTYVWNSGTGIEQKYINEIFEPGFRMSHDKNGLGFGLYNVKKIADMHDGILYADSDGHSYASFIIELKKWLL